MTVKNNDNKTKKIAMGGIFLALTIIFLVGSSIVPGLEMTFMALASLMTGFMIIETGIGGGILLYVGAIALGLILVPNKVALVPYALFFGYYGVVKYLIDRISSRVSRIIIKVIIFAAAILGFVVFAKELLVAFQYPLNLMVLAGVPMLLVYDVAFTCIMRFYMRRMHPSKLDNMKLS